MKKLFLVFGPESAGNHITTQILATMGCHGIFQNGVPQSLDKVFNGGGFAE